MTAYYNEIDPYAAQWLRELIKAGHIAHGVVDGRSIENVLPSELVGFTQCHFFAGIGEWSLALRKAGWADDRPVWTGSCPCQPFSTAGKGAGALDERHLWPAWHYLIEQCKPSVVFGEQVEAAVRHGWLDLVRSDMEAVGYAFGSASIAACAVGAPHIRKRLWFVGELGDTSSTASEGGELRLLPSGRSCDGDAGNEERGEDADCELGDTCLHGHPTNSIGRSTCESESEGGLRELERPDTVSSVANNICERSQGWVQWWQDSQRVAIDGHARRDGATGYWAGASLSGCRDGKARPIEPRFFPLAYGVSSGGMAVGRATTDCEITEEQAARLFSRVGVLKGAGNAIVPQVAQAFIESYLQTKGDELC